MSTMYSIRHLVHRLHDNEMEQLLSVDSESFAMADYRRYCSNYPNEYFEIVKVEHNETCLSFTPMTQVNIGGVK